MATDLEKEIRVDYKKQAFLRDNGKCRYCGLDFLESLSAFWSYTVDHVVQKSEGGPDVLENIVTCCVACNGALSRAGQLKTFQERRNYVQSQTPSRSEIYSLWKERLRATGNTFSARELRARACLRAATAMFSMWQEKGSSDTRLLTPPIIPDELVTVGESIAGRDHREHVVPRNIICYECHDMFLAGASVQSVAEFIGKYLKIVWISRAEQQKLDQGRQLNLRQRMPDGWSFESGSIFARLDKAGIEVKLYADET